MTKTILTRMMGLFSSKQKKLQPRSTPQTIKRIENNLLLTHKTIVEPSRMESDTKDVFFNDSNEEGEESDMSRFLKIQGDLPQMDDYLSKMEYYINHAHQHTSDEYSTISSATGSSNITMEEALFSHISSDSRSEITAYSSESLKIAVRAQSPGRSNPTPSDVGQYQIVDLEIPERTENIAALPKIIFDQHLSTATKSNYERYFCNMYTQALYYLSPKNKGYSPAHAFHFFETTAVQGNQVYADLNDRTRMLISFAQYRAGRMLYEAEYTEEDDTYGHHQQQGLIYLLDSKKNGNAHASYILGVYAQECGDLDRACQLYYEASKAGILDAKVSFGIAILRRRVCSFQIEDAICALIEASNKDHSFASLTLALYYDREQQFQTAMKYCQRVKMSPANPIYGFTKYVIGIIHLKAGNDDAAFQYIAESAEVAHEDGHGAWACLALRKLGVLFLLGVGTPRNPVNAFRWIKKASDRGDEAASIILGQMYTSGLGCPVDRVSAVSLFERHRNNVAAKLSLGLLMMKFNPEYAYQEFLSIINFKSTSYDEENWDMQSIKCEAAVRIAIWTFNGIGGVKRDPHEAVLLLKNLSDQRNYTGAHYWLAWAYLEGVKDQDGSMIVIKNPSKAFEYFLKGAKKNDVKCLYQVGRMVQSGIHEHPQYQKQDAFQFFLKAAQLNHVESQTQVGIYYFNGLAPVCHNLDKAFEYFSLAARHNNTEAILYLADYLVKNNTKNHNINVLQIYHELNRAAAAKNPIAYRMLALVVNSGVDLSVTYESILKRTGDQELWAIYQSSKQEAYNVESRFALRCLWKALELGDHKSGQHLCKLFPKMVEDDVVKTIYTFIASEGPIPGKMSLALAQFLVVCGKKSLALKKYLEVADYQGLSTTAGWSACLEAAKLILVEKQGKARSKSLIFSYLQAMVKYNGKELFLPYFLLARCHEKEICNGCNASLATSFYEKALFHRESHKYASSVTSNNLIEINIRTKLIKSYYTSYQDSKLEEQLNELDALLNGLPSNKQTNENKAELLYYRGLLSLHNANISNNREIARAYLSKSKKFGHILACLELGYLYATMEGEEELADACFFEVEENRSTPINFQGRLTESMVLVRPQKFKNPAEDYPKEFRQMKLAAAITYSLFDMERQAVDWLREISDQPLAQILHLYYKMKDPSNQTAKAIQILSNLMAPFETDHTLDYNARMILSYGQFRLGQCFELGHSVSVDEAAAAEYYNKACAFLKSNEMYEKLAEISEKNGSHNATDLFPTLYNAAHNNKDATFKLAQYYESQATNSSLEKAISHYRKAADLGHAEACYRYAKYRIKKTMETTIRQEGTAASSKIAADYLRLAASKNHDSAFYELGMLELKAGMYEEAIDDLKEADFLNCSEASYQLGELYSTGFIGTIQNQVTFKINQNYETAYDYFMHAYQNNPKHILTIIKLGSFYEQGLYKKQDLAKAKQWYMKALSLRKDDGIAEYALGCLEETNIELSGLAPTNALRKTAYEWFTKSYTLGNRDAKFKVGVYLLHGWVDPHGTETEKRGLEILIEENNDSELKAMIVLAKYFEKKGEYQVAFDYWRNAEMLEDPEALEYIGKCYEEGLLGQDINLEEATSYKQRAIEARKHAKETQCSVMGFKSDYSDERN